MRRLLHTPIKDIAEELYIQRRQRDRLREKKRARGGSTGGKRVYARNRREAKKLVPGYLSDSG